MDETRAREIASWWHDGQSSALYAFCSSGYVGEGLAGEISRCQAEVKAHIGNYTQDDIRQLRLLAEYVGGREVMHSTYPHDPGYLHDCPACEAQCFCTPGNSECVFEGEHNGSAVPTLDTFRDWYGDGDQGEEYASDGMGNGACLYRLDNGELWVFQWDDAGFEDCGQVTREEWERISGSYYVEEDEA